MTNSQSYSNRKQHAYRKLFNYIRIIGIAVTVLAVNSKTKADVELIKIGVKAREAGERGPLALTLVIVLNRGGDSNTSGDVVQVPENGTVLASWGGSRSRMQQFPQKGTSLARHRDVEYDWSCFRG